MEVKPLEVADEMEYREYVRSSPAGNYCMDLAWRDILAQTYGKEPNFWICRDSGSSPRILGVAASFWLESIIFGRKLVSLPYLDYGGILADNQEVQDELLDALRWSANSRHAKLELRQEQPLLGITTPHNAKVKMNLDLRERTVEGYWDELDAKVRNQIRKSEKSGVSVRSGKEELLDEFYRVFCVNMRDLGSPVHSKEIFRYALERLPGAEIILSEWKGYCVGGLFRIQWGDTLSIPWASSLRSYRSYCPNNAMYWDTLTTAFLRKCARVDFGRSTKDAGTYHFKKQWLAEEMPLPWYTFSPEEDEALVGESPSGMMEVASTLWSKLPTRYANWMGPQIRGAISN